MQKVNQKYTFTHKLTTKRNFQTPSLFFLSQPSQNGTHRIVGYQRQWRIHLCCLQKSIRWRYLMRGSEANFGFGRDAFLPPKAAVFRCSHSVVCPLIPLSGIIRPYYVSCVCFCQALCYALFWIIKDCYPESPSSPGSFAPHSSSVTNNNNI